MRKSTLAALTGICILVFAALQCGESHCKKYAANFCKDEKSPACAGAKERAKGWSSSQCRIELNKVQIEQQSKDLDKELQ